MTYTQVINLTYLKTMAEGDADLEKTMLEMILNEFAFNSTGIKGQR